MYEMSRTESVKSIIPSLSPTSSYLSFFTSAFPLLFYRLYGVYFYTSVILTANFINVLCDNKIFVTKVRSTPIKDPLYKCLYEIVAIFNKKEYRMEFGILYTETMQVDELKKVEFERISLAFYNRNLDVSSVFLDLDQLDFCITKLDTSRVIIIG